MARASLRSTPEQKALPAPVIATTETSGSTSAVMIADRSAEDKSLDKALRRSGRFRVKRRTLLAVAILRTSSFVVIVSWVPLSGFVCGGAKLPHLRVRRVVDRHAPYSRFSMKFLYQDD